MERKEAQSRRRPTIIEVAEVAGVSRATASRALNGKGYVADPVRKRVHDAAREIGYVVDAMARSLKSQSSRSIGVVVSDLRNSFYADLASGVGREAAARGYTMVLFDNRGSESDELHAAESLVAWRVAGVVATAVTSELVRYLSQREVPMVEVDRRFAPGVADAVVIDNFGAAFEVTVDLLELGHRRIALMIDETAWTTGRERLGGYRAALTKYGLPFEQSLVVSAGWNAETAVESATSMLVRPDRPTAIFAANNLLAEGTWRAAASLGISVPADLSVVGFDESPWMSMVNPGVSTVQHNAEALGAAAVDALARRLDDPDAGPRTVVLPTKYLRRGSVTQPTRR